MIRLSNGHVFEYMSASGAMSYDGKGWPWEQPWRWIGLLDTTLFTSVTKTLTMNPTKGNLKWYNPLGCVRFIKDGVVNAVGLNNPGIDWWCKNIAYEINSKKNPLIVSIFGEPIELAKIAARIQTFDVLGIEVNASCPNTNTNILSNTDRIIESCRMVKAYSRLPLILKLSVTHDVQKIIKEVGGIVEAISINSIPWSLIFPNRKSPLEFFGGGGVSGKIAQPIIWNFVKKLVGMTKIPIIGPSVWEFQDIAKIRNMGAKAVSFGSVFMPYPWRPTLYIRKEKTSRKF